MSNSSSCGISLVSFSLLFASQSISESLFLEALRVFRLICMAVRVNPNFLCEKKSIDVLIAHFAHGSISKS